MSNEDDGQKGNGKRRGGRQKGALNKRTIERALRAQGNIADAKITGRKLSVDRLEEYAELTWVMARRYMPALPGAEKNPEEDEIKFENWFRLALECAKLHAPYQSPTLRAIMVAPPPPPDSKNFGATAAQLLSEIASDFNKLGLLKYFSVNGGGGVANRDMRVIEGTAIEDTIGEKDE